MPSTEEIKNILRNTDFLGGATDAMLDRIAGVLERQEVAAGHVVFEKGDAGTSMYIIARGRVRVHDGDLVFKHMSCGEVFGEMAALDSDVRTASITAEEDTALYRLDQGSLYALMATHPAAARTVIQGMCKKQRSMAQDVTDHSLRVRTLERELEIGRRIQSSFLPEALPQIRGWEIAAFFRAAREVAGDFYDAFELRDDGHVGLVIGDVCDKGVGAALFMTLFRSLIRALSMGGEFMHWSSRPSAAPGAAKAFCAEDSLRRSVTLTNNYVANTHGSANMFASLFLGLLEPRSGVLSYINAGHEAPVIVNAAGVKARLAPTGAIVGIMADMDYEVGQTQLDPGDTFVAFTDGVPEALDAGGGPFTEERLIALAEVSHQSATGLLEDVVAKLDAFIGSASQFDDITLLSVRREE